MYRSKQRPRVLGTSTDHRQLMCSQAHKTSAESMRTANRDHHQVMAKVYTQQRISMILIRTKIPGPKATNQTTSQDRDHKQPNISQSTTLMESRVCHPRKRTTPFHDIRTSRMSGLSQHSCRITALRGESLNLIGLISGANL